MFSNFKERFMTALAPDLPPLPSNDRSDHHHRRFGGQQMPDKFPYARPPFLQLLTADELRASADHNVRPIIVPRDINLLPWGTCLPPSASTRRRVSKDELIIGALESAFFSMDSLIAQDSNRYRDAGGCTACVSLFIDGKMYVANAGDSRAVLCQRRANQPTEPKDSSVIEPDPLEASCYPVPFSADHTPETERERLLNVARLKPHLMANHYVAMEYAKRPHIKDMGQRILCRQGTMKGWTYKTLTRDDLRMPVVNGEGKRSRLLGTLGVSRGFGDHELLAINTGIQIKPFLTPHPDVRQRDLTQVVSIPDEHNQDGDYGVLVMATDGLWDVSENEAVSRTVFQTLSKYPTEKHRYTMVAQELVARARGKINDSGHWRLADSKAAATVDDISVIVIPVYQYYKEHIEWTQNYTRDLEKRRRRAQANMAQEAQEGNLLNGVIAEEAHVEEEEEDGEVVVLEAKAQIQSEPLQLPHAEAEEVLVVEISTSPEQSESRESAASTGTATATADEEASVTAPASQRDSATVAQQQQQRSRKGNKGKH
ncbi:GL13426 [Drosophila persimilis]|uniref:GL13426 n=1 Tax=Drosophila persimilis TaxID=7234 RepID=B4H2Y8_DROPE|nr:GL13426 [Drosophila persimilis]